MDLRQMRYFLAIAREGNFTRAAARIHVSQPALSKQVQDLEEETGTPLFYRRSHGVELTAAGRLMLKRASDIVELVRKTEEEFNSLSDSEQGDIYIGIGEAETNRGIFRCMKRLRERHPRFRFHLSTGNSEELLGRMDRGLLDFAVGFVMPDPAKYDSIELGGREPWGVLMREEDALASKASVTRDDLRDLPLILSREGFRDDYPKWFGKKLASLTVVADLDLAYGAKQMVEEGLGYLVTFDRLFETGGTTGLVFRPLDPPLVCRSYLIWPKSEMFSAAAGLFLEACREAAGPETREA
ncbi:MAG: LysR family transcriptional regulator [Sutterellaceae bacterium]|nr:LysR family transcriptional regulator [Sutterellaceae bacterium]MDD7441183.1 LysR family transcriptional regulator [Sutterellaceae bacterium]MDY2868841.1 LysR family transcriptional regulator [Mesosutterella sp.]